MPVRVAASRRYAEAAFDLARADGSLERWARDLDLAGSVLGRQDVARVVDNPAIPTQERVELTERLLANSVSQPVRRLVRLLVERGRGSTVARVAEEFHGLLDREQGVVRAVVTTAAPLTDADAEAVRQRVETMAGKRVTMRTQIDETLIGGLTVQIGDRLVDASVRGRLERLRSELISGVRAR